MSETNGDISRRQMLAIGVRCAGAAGALALLGGMALGKRPDTGLWQIDPLKCIQCGKCATSCVLNPSAVKCVNIQKLCGFCKLCTGFFTLPYNDLISGAENQLCPTGALKRRWVENEYYEYTIDAPACIGCGRCVKGCELYGNGSLHLQIDHGLCVNCNRCSIAAVCPSQAISRVPREQEYQLKTKTRTS